MSRPSLGKSKVTSTPKATPKSTPKSTPKATPKSAKSTPKTKSKVKAPAKLYSHFLPIPLSLPCPSSSNATHYLFVRPHSTKSTDDADVERAARTLFVANIPVDAGEHDLRSVFGNWGVVEGVEMGGGGGEDVLEAAVRGLPVDSDSEDDDEEEDGDGDKEDGPKDGEVDADGFTFVGTGAKEARKRRRKPSSLPASVPELVPLSLTVRTPYGLSGTRSAQLVFVDPVSVSRAMSYSGPPIILKLGEGKSAEPTGLAAYEGCYASLRPSLSSVRAHADSAMARHDHLHSLLLASRAKAHGAGALIDEDGFTVVLRGGRYGRTAGRAGDKAGPGVGVASRAAANAAAAKTKGRGAGELKDFYQFQSVDRKRKELADMRARFDEDRRKVEDLKRQRRFKPY